MLQSYKVERIQNRQKIKHRKMGRKQIMMTKKKALKIIRMLRKIKMELKRNPRRLKRKRNPVAPVLVARKGQGLGLVIVTDEGNLGPGQRGDHLVEEGLDHDPDVDHLDDRGHLLGVDHLHIAEEIHPQGDAAHHHQDIEDGLLHVDHLHPDAVLLGAGHHRPGGKGHQFDDAVHQAQVEGNVPQVIVLVPLVVQKTLHLGNHLGDNHLLQKKAIVVLKMQTLQANRVSRKGEIIVLTIQMQNRTLLHLQRIRHQRMKHQLQQGDMNVTDHQLMVALCVDPCQEKGDDLHLIPGGILPQGDPVQVRGMVADVLHSAIPHLGDSIAAHLHHHL